MLIFWILVFLLSLTLLLKSTDWLVESAEKIGLGLKISPFIVGVTIVAIGTSLPELASSTMAVLKNSTEMVVANVVGSNLANIFLIVGICSVIAKVLTIRRSLINLDSPLLAATTILFIFVVIDKKVTAQEGFLLLTGFLVYFLYTIFQKKDEQVKPEIVEILPSKIEMRKKEIDKVLKESNTNIKVLFLLFLGAIGLALGANYTIESAIKISKMLGISASIISITAIAVGTSLPELAVSAKTVLNKKHEIALGNIFGSNVFNTFIVTGIPALIKPLSIDEKTLYIGVPFMTSATLLFVISGISRKIHIWEGLMYLLIYTFFLIQLF